MGTTTRIRCTALALAVLCLSAGTAAAQQFQVGGNYGLILGGQATTYDGDINIVDTDGWGVIASFEFMPLSHFEIFYLRQDSRVELEKYPSGLKVDLADIAVDHIQAGVLRETQYGNVRPFGCFTMGASYFNPKGVLRDGEWRFSVSLGTGLKIHSTSGKFGFRLQARALMPVAWTGTSVFCSSDSGCDLGMSAGSQFIQADLSAGMFIAFGRK
jgi:hypothetical protein